MNHLTLALFSAIMLYACNNVKQAEEKNAVTSAEQHKNSATPPVDPAAIQKAMEDFSKPGPMHQWLAGFNGTWEAVIISFMNPEKPDTSNALQYYSMTLNGLYQEAKLSGNMMGMPFEGRSLTGFDNAKKIFVTTWIDNLSSGFTYMTGSYDVASKTLHLKGTQTNPVNGKDGNIREVMKILDDNTYTLEMYGDGADDKEMKFMEARFKRKK